MLVACGRVSYAARDAGIGTSDALSIDAPASTSTPAGNPVELWMDDVVIDRTRPGCL